jgi:hypothetical protein
MHVQFLLENNDDDALTLQLMGTDASLDKM